MRETLQITSFKDVIPARCEVLAMLYIFCQIQQLEYIII
jgi:hypothetical protein